MTLTSSTLSAHAGGPLRIAVVGGGITGLAAAHRAIEIATQSQRLLKLSLYEATPRLGGVFGSEQIGDYLIERGADSFITNKPWGVSLCRRLGLEDDFITTNPRYRRSFILNHGRPVPTPDGFNLMAPARLWPMMLTPLLSWSGKIRLLQERFIPRRRNLEDESLGAFVRRRMGAEMLERIVQPMVGGIYTSDPDHLSLLATLPRFLEMEQKYGSLLKGMNRQAAQEKGQKEASSASGARYGLFISLRNGMQQLLDTLEQRIVAYTHRRTGPRVTSIERSDQVWRIGTGQGQFQDVDGVILALPARGSAEMLSEVAPACAAQLQKIESASSAIVVTGHSLRDIKHPLEAFGLVIPHCEGRRILATSFLSRKFAGRAPEGKIVIRTFVGGAMQPEELTQSDSGLIETTLQELHSIFGVRGTPDFAVATRYPQGMPQYTVGHLDRVAAIQQEIRTLPQLQLAGNYFHGVGIPDCIQSGEQAAEELLQSLNCAVTPV